MNIITSYIPGRIRLRHRILRDEEISKALIDLLWKTGIVTSIDRNGETGSILITYDAKKIPSVDVLKKNLFYFVQDFSKLRFRILYYTPQDKAFILDMIKKAEALLPEVKGKLGISDK